MMCDYYLGTELLVVFDQHAAHERVRLEQLTKGDSSIIVWILLLLTVIFVLIHAHD